MEKIMKNHIKTRIKKLFSREKTDVKYKKLLKTHTIQYINKKRIIIQNTIKYYNININNIHKDKDIKI